MIVLWVVFEASAASDEVPAVLAVSWQPAFCETAPRKPECRSQTSDRYDATHFALHGLWPQPRREQYCDVSPDLVALDRRGRWLSLPPLDLSEETRTRLERVMPGHQSGLHRHEWYKHGSCYGTPERYFADSIALLDILNASPVRTAFAEAIGKNVQTSTIRARFNEAFGQGVGNRVRIACSDSGGRRLIRELTIGLVIDTSRPIAPESLADFILAAAPTKPGCPGGEIDAVERETKKFPTR